MRIGLLGTGNLALALGRAWVGVGHSVVITGRNADHARSAAHQVGPSAAPVDPADLADLSDVVVVAIAWNGLEDALTLVGGPDEALSGMTVIDCTNPVDYATGRLLPGSGSAAELVARTCVGAHVVKALHLFAGASWPFTGEPAGSPVVAICGDDAAAVGQAGILIADLGGRASIVGGLDAARQTEEAAGFVMRLVAAGANPRLAVPDVDPALVRTATADR